MYEMLNIENNKILQQNLNSADDKVRNIALN